MDSRGFPASLPEFQRVFPDDAACAEFLERLRWPEGFTCPKCGVSCEPYRFPQRASVVLRCRSCHANTSLTAGTVMQKSHTPLSVWFWGAYLVTTQTPGQSALQFQRQLELRRYETAFQLLHKLRAGTVRPERDTIGGAHPVEIDEVLVGGRTRGEGRGVHHMATVVGAVEIRRRRRKRDGDRPGVGKRLCSKRTLLKRRTYAGRLRLRVVDGRGAQGLTAFVKDSVMAGAIVRTDGWIGYENLSSMGYRHKAVVMDGDPERADKHLPMIHRAFSNLKTWLQGTHHGVSQQHLQAYLNEYVFRFNRRFYPMTAFHSVLGIAANVVPPTYKDLYRGVWTHPVG